MWADMWTSYFKNKHLPPLVFFSFGRLSGSCAPSSRAPPPPRSRAPWGCWSAAWEASCPIWSCSPAGTSSQCLCLCQDLTQEYASWSWIYWSAQPVTDIWAQDSAWQRTLRTAGSALLEIWWDPAQASGQVSSSLAVHWRLGPRLEAHNDGGWDFLRGVTTP